MKEAISLLFCHLNHFDEKAFVPFIDFIIELCTVICQDNLPSAYAIHADTAESLILDDHYVQIAGDQQGTWTIEQLTQSTCCR
ncbi:MAG: hypothetical protein WDO19_27585 [Bacteroidota bacterium]